MNKIFIMAAAAVTALPVFAQPKAVDVQSAWDLYRKEAEAERVLPFDIFATGKKTPIKWGFDTAWNDYGNMLRGVRHSGADAVSCARVSFQPWAEITEKGVLPEKLQKNLDARMATVGLIGKKVDIVLNLDGGDPTIKEIYGGWKYENPEDPWYSPKEYIGNVVEQGPKWADLIDATAAAVEAKGYKVITASPLNEPDLELNGTPIELFYEISKNLKDFDKYPRFRDIRISGGNTLNNDQAMKWYEYNKEFLDEGNTHQLAGSFDTYAEFFKKVREDGKYATADELHNVMEAIVGVEYGMQTGIWWGTAEQCRGEFMKASFGDRLSYAENRDAWSAGAVYRTPEGKIQGFLGCSERQAKPSSYKFVSLNGDMFMDGFGPAREFTVNLPGDKNGAYQTEAQRNAETVIAIENGEDVRPYVSGKYALINAADRKAASPQNGETSDGAYIVSEAYSSADYQLWDIAPVPNDNGGDFSYYFIRNSKDGKSMDDYGWNIEVGAPVRLYGHSGNAVQQWALEYAGDNWFRIRGRNSGLYLEYESGAAGAHLVQKEKAETPAQKWRLLDAAAPLEFDAPNAPTGLTATPRSASVLLGWDAVADAGEVTYAVLRAEKGSDSYITIARGLEGTSFLDNSVENKEYSYKVFAMDASGNRSVVSQTIDAGVSGVKGMIAHFPLKTNISYDGENNFSIKIKEDPFFTRGRWSLYGTQYGQLPYSIFGSNDFTIAISARATFSETNKTLLSIGAGEQEYININVTPGCIWTIGAVKDGKNEEVQGPAGEYGVSTHVAISVSGSDVSFYINGKAIDSSVLKGMVPDHRILAYIGRGQSLAKSYYTGSLNNLSVYNYALDASEIAALAAGGSGVGEIAGAATEVTGVEYYTTQGVRISAPSERGVTIVRTSYSDGTVRIEKIIR